MYLMYVIQSNKYNGKMWFMEWLGGREEQAIRNPIVQNRAKVLKV
jgi:hypothetical protein